MQGQAGKRTDQGHTAGMGSGLPQRPLSPHQTPRPLQSRRGPIHAPPRQRRHTLLIDVPVTKRMGPAPTQHYHIRTVASGKKKPGE